MEIVADTHRGTHVIAKKFYPKGTLRIEMHVGELIPAAEMQDDFYALQIDEETFVGSKEADPEDHTCFLNHSCAPNMAFENGKTVLVNIADIHPGDELTWDYSTSIDDGNFAMPCGCNAPGCRGTITSFGELPSKEKWRLLPLSLAYLQQQYKS